MQNIELVTAHLRRKLANIPGANAQVEVLTLVPMQIRKVFTWSQLVIIGAYFFFFRNL